MVRLMATVDVQISSKYPTFFNTGTPNCATSDPEAFFLERGAARWEVDIAKKVCNSCMLIGVCRQWAIENHEMGIWGGTTEMERKRIRRMRSAVKDAHRHVS